LGTRKWDAVSDGLRNDVDVTGGAILRKVKGTHWKLVVSFLGKFQRENILMCHKKKRNKIAEMLLLLLLLLLLLVLLFGIAQRGWNRVKKAKLEAPPPAH